MHYVFLNPWPGGISFENSGVLPLVGWFVGLIIIGWLGINWWSAHIARQFERDPTAAPQPTTNWALLLLFVAACFGLLLVL